MKQKGFTLAELLGVIIIIALLTIIVLPPVINQIKKMQGNVSEVSFALIKAATELHINNNKNSYPLTPSANYCITLEQLVNVGQLEAPIIDTETGNEISLNKIVKIEVNSSVDINYSLVDTCP